ncbi:HCP-like protein [Aureobasidium subglaciale]|nr:HCP-like protein [Aureobasidium subglaciale]
MDDPAAQLHQNLQDAVSDALAMRRPVLHHLSADTAWLLMIPRPIAATKRGGRVYFNILIDPWLSGTQTDYTSWLSKQWHAEKPRVPSIAAVEDLIRETESLASGLRLGKGRKSNADVAANHEHVETFIDAVAISHQFTDHCHEQTMRDVHPDVPVFAIEKAIPLIESWKHFRVVQTIPHFSHNPDWHATSVPSLPEWLGISRLVTSSDMLYFHSALMVTFNNHQSGQASRRSSSYQYTEPEEEDEAAEAVIYTPHGIHSYSEDIDLVTKASPPIKTLAFMHGLEDVSLRAAQQLNLGAHNGLQAQRKLKASYWVGTHDEDKKGTGVVGWLLKRKKISVKDAVASEKERNTGSRRKDSVGDEVIGTFEGKVALEQQEPSHPDVTPHIPKGQHGSTHDKLPPHELSEAVKDALKALRKIRPATSRLARLSKPSGVVGTTIHYAKELFVLLFMNQPGQKDLLTTDDTPPPLTPALAHAVTLLQHAAEQQDVDALWLLAEMNFYGNFTYPRNYSRAFEYYQTVAYLNGNSSAQYMLGFMYATGIGNAVPQDQARALLYHTFAAEQGDIRSQMTLAYRHHSGIATPRDCEESVHWYRLVAKQAVDFYKSGPPGGHSLVKNAFRLVDEDGGIYGEGASVSSSGPNAKTGGPTSDAYADLDDVLEFLDFQSRKGDLKATFNLARIYYDGSRGLARNFPEAKDHFMQVARLYWTTSGKVKSDVSPAVEKLAPKAAGYLGRMFLRGEGTEQSYTKAKIWFARGIEHGDALSQYSMGVMYMEGLGVPQNSVKAADYFSPAADQDLAVAQTNLGILFMDQGDIHTARSYFDLAARNSHIEAFYYLAELSDQGVGRDRSCGVASVYYKIAAEKAEVIHSSFIEANEAYDRGDLETAIIAYMMAAEQGYETAQANVGYLLDHTRPRYSLPSIFPFLRRRVDAVSDAALALIYWTRSARQSNTDALVKMGDYYLDGIGTTASPETAAMCYQAAAEGMASAQAMWNLGWMHENGIGIEQDFHLAKRFYDQALGTNAEAYLPAKLSLAKLRLRSWWNGVSGGSVNSIRDEPSTKPSRSLSQWLNDFLEADAAYYADHFEADDWDDAHNHMPGGDDFYDDATDIDDGFVEMFMIVGLAAMLAFLVYYRQQRQQEARRRAEQQGAEPAGDANAIPPQQQQDQGFFPPPGNPEFANWVAGGVGH